MFEEYDSLDEMARDLGIDVADATPDRPLPPQFEPQYRRSWAQHHTSSESQGYSSPSPQARAPAPLPSIYAGPGFASQQRTFGFTSSDRRPMELPGDNSMPPPASFPSRPSFHAPLQRVEAAPQGRMLNRPEQAGPKTTAGIQLRPVSDLPDVYRSVFKFGVFNAIQSQCFDTAVNSNENMVISAPTGSGKTVLFELAIIRLLMSGQSNAKCVYMAPTKALCTERYNDWTKKFQHLGVACCQMTGDTVHSGYQAWTEAKRSTIIVTTPEKWDSLTRNWREHQEILSSMQLFLVDEVHILNESRGSAVEVCLARMKTLGSSVRFILLSATAPNIEDIAAWIGSSSQGHTAKTFKFGEEYRPCKIQRHVYAYPNRQQNDHQFSRTLDYKLFELLQRHGGGKPILIFCPTRKGVVGTAEQLAKEYSKLVDQKQNLPWPLPKRGGVAFQDNQMRALYASSIGVHHAGLNMDDRRLTEELFISGQIHVVVATSTLAVGVNLPAHTVVIKGTIMWAGAGWAEYPDLDIVQMIGRAGRPQFDTEGTAIIMCSTDKEAKYNAITSGQTIIESCLHLNLTEHLNSEIGLGTITDTLTAKKWLHNSFFLQRLKKNPSHYALGKSTDQTWEERLDDLVNESANSLCALDLIKADGGGENRAISATAYGEIMSKYYIRYQTMGLVLKLSETAGLKEILETISQAEEFNDVRVRASDKPVYNKLREHNDIRFHVNKLDKSSDKVMILVQAVLGGISLNAPEYKSGDCQPSLEAFGVFKHVNRIARAIVDVAIVRQCGSQLKSAMELVRSLAAKAWEDRPIVLRQISQIGEKSIKVLASAGVATIASLRQQNASRIEMLLNRRPPFGSEILAETQLLPQYSLKITEDYISPSNGDEPVTVTLSIEAGLASPLAGPQGKKPRNSTLGYASILVLTSELTFVDFRRIPVKALQASKSFSVTVSLTKPSQSISVTISSENYAGIGVVETYKPKLSAAQYPTRNTRPLNSLEAELEGLEADADCFIMTEEEIQDLTDKRHRQLGRVVSMDKSVLARTKPSRFQRAQYIPTTRHPPAYPLENTHAIITVKIKQNVGTAGKSYFCCMSSGFLPSPSLAANNSCSDGLSKPPPQKTSEEKAFPPELAGSRTPKAGARPTQTSLKAKATHKAGSRTKNDKLKQTVLDDALLDDLERANDRTQVALSVPAGSRLTVHRIGRPDTRPERRTHDDAPRFTQIDDVIITGDNETRDEDLPDLPDLFSAASSTHRATNSAKRLRNGTSAHPDSVSTDGLVSATNKPSRLFPQHRISHDDGLLQQPHANPVTTPSKKRQHDTIDSPSYSASRALQKRPKPSRLRASADVTPIRGSSMVSHGASFLPEPLPASNPVDKNLLFRSSSDSDRFFDPNPGHYLSEGSANDTSEQDHSILQRERGASPAEKDAPGCFGDAEGASDFILDLSFFDVVEPAHGEPRSVTRPESFHLVSEGNNEYPQVLERRARPAPRRVLSSDGSHPEVADPGIDGLEGGLYGSDQMKEFMDWMLNSGEVDLVERI